MKIAEGDVFLFVGVPFVVRQGIEVDKDGNVAVPISWMKHPGLVEMHSATALMLQAEQGHLVRCLHDRVKEGPYGGRQCATCGKALDGWFCPSNPDGTARCRYSESMDCCDFCGQPEERK